MDRSLREMGVGDLSVGKRVRGLAEAFSGRLAAYRASIADPAALADALTRNVWSEGCIGEALALAHHVLRARQIFLTQSPRDIASGEINLP